MKRQQASRVKIQSTTSDRLCYIVDFYCHKIRLVVEIDGAFWFGVLRHINRTKEIGIRKVMGSSTRQIMALLSSQFVRLLIVASLIAFPVSQLWADNWLDDYAYRIVISWWLYAIAGAVVFGIALFTVFWQTWRTANANPVDSLRDE
ncbi:MAG: FtsX-like permease family protein [Bacteroidetes bacterium]|nr:FtsX-like permease family protein [Bacteroidota bacterium]